ncbi:MAG: LytTR family DNA-binding domain-containing protein [Flavobacteriales bacterium]
MQIATSGNISMFEKLHSFLNKPFPGPDSIWVEVKGMLIASVIVFLFLFLFKPFGMNTYNGSIFLLCLKFGLVSLVASLGYLLFTTYVLKIHKDVESWTMKRWILDMMLLILCITLANYIFVLYHYNSSFSLWGLGNMLVCTMMVAVFPIVFFGYRKQLRLERTNSASAETLSETLNAPEHKAPESLASILAIESMQNYVHIYKLTNGNFEKETVRMTLTAALAEYGSHGLIKCHRSFLVNPSQIKRADGNAQGLKLTLSHKESPIIPVSRTYISSVKSAL